MLDLEAESCLAVKKVSAQAKSKRQSGQPTFTHVEEEFSEDGSVYIDSGEEEIW